MRMRGPLGFEFAATKVPCEPEAHSHSTLKLMRSLEASRRFGERQKGKAPAVLELQGMPGVWPAFRCRFLSPPGLFDWDKVISVFLRL